MKDLWYKILTAFFTMFSAVMVKIQPIWDKYQLLIALGTGLVIGLIIGWGIFPVEWINATPGHLRADYRSYYLDYVAQEYVQTGDATVVRTKLGLDLPKSKHIPWLADKKALTSDLQTAIKEASQYNLHPEALQYLSTSMPTILASGEKEASSSSGGMMKLLLLLLMVFGAVLIIFYLLRRKAKKGSEEEEEGELYGPPVEDLVGAPTEAQGEKPLKVFPAVYKFGDDYFDPSFSIEVGPDFLGECGVGFSETIGSGKPKKATAFEVWLFDKSDIQTVTKVLASEYAFNDPELREKLEAKGEVVMLKPGAKVMVETTALRVQAYVTEIEYAADNPAYIQTLNVELRAWVKKAD